MIDLLLDRSTHDASNILRRLRDSTREQHRTLDTALSRYDLSERKDYEVFLRIHWCALTELRSQWRNQDDAEFTRLLSMLENDLGCNSAAPNDSRSGCARERPPAEAVGVSYVIRGSRLGAALLRRRVRGNFPADYLSAQLVLPWRGFLEELEAYALSARPTEINEVIFGARTAFGVYSRTVQEQAAND